MAPEKRKVSDIGTDVNVQTPEQRKKEVKKTASSERPNRRSTSSINEPRSLRSSLSHDNTLVESGIATPTKRKSVGRPKKQTGRGRPSPKVSNNTSDGDELASPKLEVMIKNTSDHSKKSKSHAADEDDAAETLDGPQYWLMKAEPESRIEKGKDVKFSIDDLKAAKEPEAWDGVRNYAARNNMRAMMKGDQAFFYHSNCKVPGIAGVMEIVQEHSVDETAHDPAHPYYDEKSDKENPKWCVVHVELRQKFPKLIKLKELQKYGKEGGVLEGMQVLKQSRLSVSKVLQKEWDFIMRLTIEDEADASAKYEPQMKS